MQPVSSTASFHPARIQIEGTEEAPQVRLHGVGWSEEITAARGSQEASPYRAPEQIGKLRGGDPKVDQYGLGVIASSLAGCLPFTAESADLADAGALRDRAPAHISEQVPGLPAGVDDVVARALAFEPGRRYTTILDFAEALRAVAAGEAAASTPGPTPPPDEPVRPIAAALPGTTPAAADNKRRRRRRPWGRRRGRRHGGDACAALLRQPGHRRGGGSAGPGGRKRRACPSGPGPKKKKKDKRKRAADIHPSAAEFADDDGPTALENPATLVAAHRVLEAGLEARELRTEPVAAPGLTPPRDGLAPGMTPPPLSAASGHEAERQSELRERRADPASPDRLVRGGFRGRWLPGASGGDGRRGGSGSFGGEEAAVAAHCRRQLGVGGLGGLDAHLAAQPLSGGGCSTRVEGPGR